MGEKWSEKNRVQKYLGLYFISELEETRVQEILGLFSNHFSPMSGTLFFLFFSKHQNGKCSRYPFLQVFRTRVLDTH